MKKPLFTLALLCLITTGIAQKTTRIDQYSLPSTAIENKTIVLEMPYGQSSILNIYGDTTALLTAGNFFIDIVCTDYPSGLSLTVLNQQRLHSFLQRFPFIKKSSITKVHILRQLNGAEKEKAETMFHGLVVRFATRQTTTTMKEDIDHFDDVVELLEKDSSVITEHTVSKAEKDSILLMLKLKRGQISRPTGPVKYEPKPYDVGATGYDRTKRSPRDSVVVISPKQALKRGLITKAAYKAYDWTPWINLYYHQVGDSVMPVHMPSLTREITVKDTLSVSRAPIIPDSTLLKIFRRLRWKNYTIVGDVTVSMYPYSTQLLWWIKNYSTDSVTSSYVFFNDGDERPDAEKIIGRTGGIYAKECNSFAAVKKLIRETMEKGSGGDRPENDIEALIAGEREFPDRDFQVLIADNKAPVKDMALVTSLRKPVRIILCGADPYFINPDYLNLARKTKGSVHLAEQDLNALSLIREGEALRIGYKIFVLHEGLFTEKDEERK